MSQWKKWGVLIGTGLSSMLVSIDFTVVNTSLVAIQNSLNASVIDLQWFIAAFGIPFCVLLVIFGRLADLWGRRMILYAGMTGFGLASLAAGFSGTSLELIFWRFFQGLFGASIFPCGMALTADVFPKKEHGKALGLFFGILGVGLALGPVIGGLITHALGWHWIFFINIPVIILSFLICIPSVPKSKTNLKQKIDWQGLILIFVGLSALVIWITEGSYLGWLSLWSIALIVIAIVSLWLFYRSEKRTEHPMIPLHFFKQRSFIIGTISNIASISCMWAVIFLIPIYLQSVIGYSIIDAGLMILIMTAMTVIAPPVAGYILDKKGKTKILFLIFILLIIGYIAMLMFSLSGSIWLLFFALILIGAAWGGGNGVGGPIVLSGQHSTANAGLITGAATTVLNIFGVVILVQSGTVFRFGEKLHLHHLLNKANLTLTPRQEEDVFRVLSDPQSMNTVLSEFSANTSHRIHGIFQQSFNFGFQMAIYFLLAITIVLFGLLLYNLSSRRR